jgi:hypothetical protein
MLQHHFALCPPKVGVGRVSSETWGLVVSAAAKSHSLHNPPFQLQQQNWTRLQGGQLVATHLEIVKPTDRTDRTALWPIFFCALYERTLEHLMHGTGTHRLIGVRSRPHPLGRLGLCFHKLSGFDLLIHGTGNPFRAVIHFLSSFFSFLSFLFSPLILSYSSRLGRQEIQVGLC